MFCAWLLAGAGGGAALGIVRLLAVGRLLIVPPTAPCFFFLCLRFLSDSLHSVQSKRGPASEVNSCGQMAFSHAGALQSLHVSAPHSVQNFHAVGLTLHTRHLRFFLRVVALHVSAPSSVAPAAALMAVRSCASRR